MGTQRAAVHRQRTLAEPKKSFPPYVATHLPALHCGYRGQHIKTTLALMQGLQRQMQVSWNFWMIQKWPQMRRIVWHKMKSRRFWKETSPSTTTVTSTDSSWKRSSPTTAAPPSGVSPSVGSGSPPPVSTNCTNLISPGENTTQHLWPLLQYLLEKIQFWSTFGVLIGQIYFKVNVILISVDHLPLSLTCTHKHFFISFLGRSLTCNCSLRPSLAVCCWSPVGSSGKSTVDSVIKLCKLWH